MVEKKKHRAFTVALKGSLIFYRCKTDMADDQAQVLLCGLLRWKAFKYTTPVGTNSKVRAEPLKFSDTLV